MVAAERVEVENINSPGHVTRVDADKYNAMRRALLEALPETSPGLTAAEMMEGLLAHIPEDLFPQGDKAGWWMKAVQLNLEAKRIITRENTKPLRWHRL